jgi:antitoxin (DNA-binding transcriptional repressor) of toxin-antitoxin stability system
VIPLTESAVAVNCIGGFRRPWAVQITELSRSNVIIPRNIALFRSCIDMAQGFCRGAGIHIYLVHFMVHNMVMQRVDIHQAQTHLSRYLAELKPGEKLILCNRNEPVAEIQSLRGRKKGKRRIGLFKGLGEVPDSFFDPLPDDLLKAFNGE